jgi:hypothetical protein
VLSSNPVRGLSTSSHALSNIDSKLRFILEYVCILRKSLGRQWLGNNDDLLFMREIHCKHKPQTRKPPQTRRPALLAAKEVVDKQTQTGQ